MTLIEALKSGKKHRIIGSNTGWYLPLKSGHTYSCRDILADWEVKPEPREFMLYKMHDGTIQALPDLHNAKCEFICRGREILE